MNGGRNFGLDLVRAYAITVVVHAHGYGYWADSISLPAFLWFAIDGVTVFFVLSGFLVGGIFIRQMPANPTWAAVLMFWRRRWWRTLPTYFLVLAGLVGMEWWRGAPDWQDHLVYFLFLQNFAWPHPSFFPEAWSMPVEEWFYLGLPLVMLLPSGFLWKSIPVSPSRGGTSPRQALSRWQWLIPILTVMVACNLYRVITISTTEVTSFGLWDQELRKQVLPRFDSLMVGVLGAYISQYYPDFWRRSAKGGLVVAAILLVLDRCWLLLWPNQVYLNYGILLLNPLMVMCSFPWLTSLNCKAKGWVSVVTFISLVSYPLYLVHGSIVRDLLLSGDLPWLNMRLGAWSWLSYGLYWLVSLGLAAVIHVFFERPMTALRDRG